MRAAKMFSDQIKGETKQSKTTDTKKRRNRIEV